MSQQSFILSDGTTDAAVDAGTSGLKTFIANTPTVNQGGAPWTQNITQFGGNNVVTGTGASGVGIPRITVSNDSNILSTQSGTWIVQPGNTQNTTPWLTQDAADGPVAAGTAASKSILIGAQFNTSLPSLTTGQQAALQVDSSGRLLVGSIASALPTGANTIGAVTQASGPWTQNITQFGGNNVVTGTGASGAGIPRVTVANDSNVLATQSGTWTVQQGGAPWSVVGIRTNNTATPGSNHLAVLSAIASSASQSYTDGYQVLLSTDLSGHLRAAQGNAAGLSGAWPIKLTDGTNTAPTMDVAARAGYMRITDGTNTLGTLSTTLHADPNGDRRTIHNNATLTSNGSTVLTWIGWAEWYLVINLKNAPTGISPTISFKIEVVDPIDQTTVIDSTATVTGVTHTTAGVESLQIADLPSDTIKISWTVTGSWSGVNVTFCGHGAGNAIEGQAEDGYALHDGPVPVAGVDNSNLVHTLKVDSSGSLQVVVSNFPASATTGLSHGRVVGSSGVQAAIRATTYTEQATNFTGSIKSSSASDASAGTGARQVTIYYVDSTGATAGTEVVTLNGTTAVNLATTTKCFIEKMIVTSVGSNGSNVGTITLFTGSGGTGTTVGTIAVGTITSGAGDNQTLWAHHYVVTGKTASIGSITAGTNGNQAGIIFLKKATPTVANSVEIQLTDVLVLAASTSGIFRVPEFPITVAGPARITAYLVPSGSNTNYFSGFDYSEV